MSDLDKLKEIQETGEMLYYDTALNNALFRRGIVVLQRDVNNTANILIEFKGNYYFSEMFFNQFDTESWTYWKQVGVITSYTYETYELT